MVGNASSVRLQKLGRNTGPRLVSNIWNIDMNTVREMLLEGSKSTLFFYPMLLLFERIKNLVKKPGF